MKPTTPSGSNNKRMKPDRGFFSFSCVFQPGILFPGPLAALVPKFPEEICPGFHILYALHASG
jgi:hypothetical protein